MVVLSSSFALILHLSPWCHPVNLDSAGFSSWSVRTKAHPDCKASPGSHRHPAGLGLPVAEGSPASTSPSH